MPCTRLVSPNFMSSNNAPAPYEVIAESEMSGHDAWQAFDSLWYDTYWASTSDSGVPTWLFIDLGTAKKACATGLRCFSANYPTDWTFEGSNNRIDWDILDTQEDQYLSAFANWYDTFYNDTSYRYYMWNFTGTSDDIIIIGMAKIFIEEVTGVRDVIGEGCVPFNRV